MKRNSFARMAGMLFAALLVDSCTDAATTVIRPVSGRPSFDAVPGPPALDQWNGTLGFNGNDIRKGFNPHNPQLGDAILATFIWQGSTNVITSVIDHLTDGTPVGNTYSLVEYRTAGGISMATYLATNVQNFPQGNPSDPNPNQDKILVVTASLSQNVTHGGVMISAYKGVATAAPLSAHASAGGTSSTTTPGSTGPITPGNGSLIYSIGMTSPNAAHQPPAGLTEIANLSTFDGQIKLVGQWGVHSGSESTDPTWTWFHTAPSSWLVTNIALLPNGGGGPTSGNLTATTSTTGSDLDPDGYTVTLDGGASQAIGINSSVTFNNLSATSHSVAISGVASNCTVSGSNPRTVSVPAGGTATTAFAITCNAIPPETGNLSVSASTSGGDLDADGYTVTVDGSASQALAINGNVTFNGLSQGNHSVSLSGVASNCTVSGDNPRTVSVPTGGTASTTFLVSCTAAPTTGDLTVGASTSGADQDSDYLVIVDGSLEQVIGANGSVTFTGLSSGSHSVALDGVAGNCTVSGVNPRTISVPSGGTANTTFSVSCTALPPTTGDLTVITSTTGSSLDPNGYTVTVDGGSSQGIAINGSVTFSGLSEGNHSVQLSGIASNCSVSSGNPRTISVPAGGTASTTFAVTCVTPSGNLTVNTSTTGAGLDSDGYTVTINGGNNRSIGINSSTTYSNLAPGTYSVAISGVASNCTVSGSNPRNVTVTSGGTASTTFSVACVSPNQAPVVNAGPDQTALTGLLFSETWSFTDPDNGPWTYRIEWGDGQVTTGSKTSPGTFSNGHVYLGLLFTKFTIRITVTDSRGASHTDTKVVTIVLL